MTRAARRGLVAALLIAANPLPARAGARGERGVKLLRAGRIAEAVDALGKAFAADPKSAALATDLAYAEELRGHPAEAERLFRRAIELDPRRWYAYANLASMKAQAALGAGERDSLMALLERGQSLQQRSRDATGRAGLLLAEGDVERAAGNLGAARERLAEARRLLLTPGQERRASALRAAIDAAAARKDEARGSEEWPEPPIDGESAAQLASAERTLARDPAASLREAERLSARHRTWRGPRWLRARALIALEELDRGTRELEALLRLDPANAAAWRLLGETLAAHGGQFEAERADQALSRALALEPAWTELWEVRGRLLFRGGHPEAARLALEQAEKAHARAGDPAPPELALLLAAVRAREPASAERAGAPEPSPAARALAQDAQALLDAGNRADAAERLTRALADSPSLIDAAVLRWSLTGEPPDGTARALWDDPAGLLRLANAVRAQSLRAASPGPDEPPGAGARRDEAAADGGARSPAAGQGAAPDAREVAALVRPWVERAADLGFGEALLERARLRAEERDPAGALEDLGAAVAAGATPAQLEQAESIRSALDADAGTRREDAAALIARMQAARGDERLADLGGACATAPDLAHQLALGAAHELAGESQEALACYQAALARAPEDRAALTRLSRAAASAPVQLLAPLGPALARAASLGIASADYAQARALAAAGRTDEALAAVDRFLAAPAAPGFVEPGIAEATRLRERLERERTRASAAHRSELMVAIATIFAAASALFFFFFRGHTVARALRREPALFPAAARAIAEIRHDALKHRASALAMLGSAPRAEIARALLGERPASALVADAYALIARAADARGLQLRALRREPVFGALHADLLRAEEQLARAEGPRDQRVREVAARMALHGERLSSLLKLGPRTRLDAAQLASWIGALEAETRARGHAWNSPALQLQGLELDFPVAREPLAALFANLLRNAQAAAARSPHPRVLVRVAEERDLVGRRILELRIGDSSDEPLTLEQIESRESGRGLSLVRELVREWQGHLRIHREESPWRKSVAACFPLQAP